MVRRIQTNFPRANSKTIMCQGDSLTDPLTNMGPEWSRWTNILQAKIKAAGGIATVCNIARSGTRTDDGGLSGGQGLQMLYRFTPYLRGIPDVVIIWAGTNDWRSVTTATQSGTTVTLNSPGHAWTTGNQGLADIYGANQAGYNQKGVTLTVVDVDNLSYTAPAGLTTPATGNIVVRMQTQLNLQAMIKWVKFGCKGAYRSQADLPADGLKGQRYVVLNDTSTTGGQVGWVGDSPTITGTATASDPTVWEYRNGRTGELGWGRIANASTTPDTVTRILILGNHYLNYSSNGDTLSTPYYWFDNITGVRSCQIAASTNENVPYLDQYTIYRNRIVNGLDVQGDFAWHIADHNEHSSEYGHAIIADNVYNELVSLGWISAIS